MFSPHNDSIRTVAPDIPKGKLKSVKVIKLIQVYIVNKWKIWYSIPSYGNSYLPADPYLSHPLTLSNNSWPRSFHEWSSSSLILEWLDLGISGFFWDIFNYLRCLSYCLCRISFSVLMSCTAN